MNNAEIAKRVLAVFMICGGVFMIIVALEFVMGVFFAKKPPEKPTDEWHVLSSVKKVVTGKGIVTYENDSRPKLYELVIGTSKLVVRKEEMSEESPTAYPFIVKEEHIYVDKDTYNHYDVGDAVGEDIYAKMSNASYKREGVTV